PGGELLGGREDAAGGIGPGLLARRGGGGAVERPLLAPEPRLARVARQIDRLIQRLVHASGREVELDEAPARLDQVLARAEPLEQDLARFVAGPRPGQIALPRQHVAAVAARQPDAVGAPGAIGDAL